MIGYYIHHQGRGHLMRARAVCAHLDVPVTALTSLPDATGPFRRVLRLPADDAAADPQDATASGTLHWVPRQDPGLRARMAAIAAWIAAEEPEAVVADVSVEVALLARLHGIPVITMVLPGTRTDHPHRMLHELADALIAAWPRQHYRPEWLRRYEHKTHYVGGITRFTGPGIPRRAADRKTITILSGAGGDAFTDAAVRDCAHRYPDYRWHTAGSANWIDDLWPRLCTSHLVVSHAGQGAIADIAAAARPALVIPAARPFGEQQATAHTLETAGLATVSRSWPALAEWPELFERAANFDDRRWREWETDGAAERAAAVIDGVRRTARAAR
ncbi:glycosyltransferase [Nocardia inohanensis]|uniref:glycosyltransferase n=1 Tax=Nocardia inohanensis TaxID=209246 RepID=UPI0008300A97|nr:glycosyltransferase [Nocardia inohanensis]